MINKTYSLLLTLLTLMLFSNSYCEEKTLNDNKNQETQVDETKKISEAFGYLIGKNLEIPGVEFNLEYVIKGIKSAAAGEPAPMLESEYEEMMSQIQEKAFNKLSEQNLEEANDFLKGNKTSQNIVSLEGNKLQYEILEEGSSDEDFVSIDSKPLINYKGTLIDGTIFASSYENNEPLSLDLSTTIEGFQKGITGMKKGEKRRLFIHPDLAYGDNGQLPPNSLLIFEIEVIETK